jgi:hypothetical protein
LLLQDHKNLKLSKTKNLAKTAKTSKTLIVVEKWTKTAKVLVNCKNQDPKTIKLFIFCLPNANCLIQKKFKKVSREYEKLI